MREAVSKAIGLVPILIRELPRGARPAAAAAVLLSILFMAIGAAFLFGALALSSKLLERVVIFGAIAFGALILACCVVVVYVAISESLRRP